MGVPNRTPQYYEKLIFTTSYDKQILSQQGYFPLLLPKKFTLRFDGFGDLSLSKEASSIGDTQQLLLNIAPQDSAIRIRNWEGLADYYREKKELIDRAKKAYL